MIFAGNSRIRGRRTFSEMGGVFRRVYGILGFHQTLETETLELEILESGKKIEGKSRYGEKGSVIFAWFKCGRYFFEFQIVK